MCCALSAGCRTESKLGRLAFWVWVIAFCLFALTASHWNFGYEAENLHLSKAYVERTLTYDPTGLLQPRSRGGILDVGQYVPFMLIGHLFRKTDLEADVDAFLYAFVHQFVAAWIVVTIFELGWILYRRSGPALSCALLAAVGSVLWPYSKFGMENQQTLWVAVSLAAFLYYREWPTCRRAAWFGVALACLVLTKITGTLLAAAIGCAAGAVIARERHRFSGRMLLSHVAVVGALVLTGLLLLVVTNWLRYGDPVARRYAMGDAFESLLPLPGRVLALLVSPNKSIFLFSPVLLLTVPFWGAFFRRFPVLVPFAVAIGGVALFFLTLNTWVDERWWFSRLHFLIPLLVLPLGLWSEGYVQRGVMFRLVSNLVIVAAVVVQFVGVAVNYTSLTYVVHPSPQLNMENLVWNPQFNALRFNWYALLSWAEKERDGRSLPFLVYHRYLPAAPPPNASQVSAFDMKGWDELDLWLVEQWLHPRTAWGRPVARTLVGLFGSGLLLGVLRLLRLSRAVRNVGDDQGWVSNLTSSKLASRPSAARPVSAK